VKLKTDFPYNIVLFGLSAGNKPRDESCQEFHPKDYQCDNYDKQEDPDSELKQLPCNEGDQNEDQDRQETRNDQHSILKNA
jgi:hypothetical protein